MTYPQTNAELIQMLHEHDIKPTQQRMQIAGVLFAKPQHLSADQILDQVNTLHGAYVSKATVYNTLGLFTRKGLIREVIINSTKVFYDSTTHPHHHIYNVDTGMLTDLDADEINIGGLPTPPAGTRIDGVDVVIRVRPND
ncbi:MAG: transcriptional repressor [Gammaproteobacteria bacterium]|jgi:Fur family iron response transcriptional regulator|nr:transcriptional repressor [Gammaproteobacteria bacterium]